MGEAKRRSLNPFSFKPGGNILLKEKQELAQEAIRAANARGAACFNLAEFKEYFDALKKAKQATMEFIINYQSDDPVKYAFVISQACIEFRAVEQLYKLVVKDMASKPTEEGEEENG